MKRTRLLGTRKPTTRERKDGVDIVFMREDSNGKEYTIYGCKNDCGSWNQWGESSDVLSSNVETIEQWFNNELE